MKKLFPLTIFTLIFALAGCGNSACYNKLKEVDSLSEKMLNDSAQKALEAIEQTYKIKEGKDMAYYNLLKYQLQFRFQYEDNSYPVNDSLIDYSIAYYTKSINHYRLALCYYLKGRTKENLGKWKEAIINLKKAEATAIDIDNNSLKMRICSNIAVVNNFNEDYATSLMYELKAIKYGENALMHEKSPIDIETITWSYINISTTYSNLGKSDSCLFYANKILKYLEMASDDKKSYIYLNAAAAIEDIDTIKAKEYALKSLEIRKSNNAYQILAKIARDNKDYKLSEAYLNEALKYSPSLDWDAFILYELANTKTLMGEHEEAARISKEVHRLRDSVEYLHAQDSIKELQMAADLNYKNQTVVEEKDNRTVIVVGTFSAIILITLGAYIRKRRKLNRSITDSERKEDEYKNQIMAIENENHRKDKEIDAANRKAEKARKAKEAAHKEKESFIKATLKQQEKQKDEEEKRMIIKEKRCRVGMDIYNKVKDGTTATIYWDKESEMSLVEYYQIVSSTFKEDMKTVYAGMKSRKIVVFILKDMGLTNADIARTLSISEGAVRTHLSRINKASSLKSLYEDGE